MGCSKQQEVRGVTGTVFGTTYAVKFFHLNLSQQTVQKDLDSIFKDLNHSLSTYLPNSDISKINKGDTTLVVDVHFKKVFRKASEVWKLTDGYFDPTVGNLVNAYGFGPEKRVKQLSAKTVDSLLEAVGWEHVVLTSKGTIHKKNPHTFLDFNAVAKGYAVDVVGNYLQNLGVQNYLIEIGGEVLARGKNITKGSRWKVGIDHPQQGAERKLFKRIALENQALATSGNYRKFRVDPQTGIRFTHAVNPKTGKAERTSIVSVSVVASDCMSADAWATALMLLPLHRGQSIVQETADLDAYWMVATEAGDMVEEFSENWPRAE